MTPDDSLNLVLVDSNRTSRKGTELLLRSWGHHVIGVADDAHSGYEVVRSRKPHVAVVDPELPGGSNPVLDACDGAGVQVVLVVWRVDRRALDEALASRACGVALRSGDPDELHQAIRAATRGERYVAPAVDTLVARHGLAAGRGGLSRREREVLQLLATGMTGVQVSNHLTVSAETVRAHVRNAMRRLGARTRVQAVTMALVRHEIHL